MTMLVVDDLSGGFRLPAGTVPALDGVCLTIDEGETIALVGESGSGKTALILALMRLHPMPPFAYRGGQVIFDGLDLLGLSERSMRQVRGGAMATVLQDPMTSLNPVMTVGAQIAEAVRTHQHVSRGESRRAAISALGEVGIPNPEGRARAYPHQLSGGMRQRVAIAMALACRPKVLLADEPTTALDVTSQAQIVDLLKLLQHRHGTAVVLVTHDLGLVAQIAERVLVMYAGRLVETAGVNDLFARPLMPYTWALLQSLPSRAPRGADLIAIPGQPPNLLDLPDGCSFSPRCPFAGPACSAAAPPLRERSPGHSAACILDPADLGQRQHQLESEVSPLP
jgi:oligopeptide/dipeptide ABC transporter ATP-binding protein